jgi:hypothetical protein
VQYDPRAVVTVPVKRGVVTHVVLDADESSPKSARDSVATAAKPKQCGASPHSREGAHLRQAQERRQLANNLAVVTDRRTHAFRFVVLPMAMRGRRCTGSSSRPNAAARSRAGTREGHAARAAVDGHSFPHHRPRNRSPSA